MAAPRKMGKMLPKTSQPARAGKRGMAPGQMKKQLGLKSASSIAPGRAVSGGRAAPKPQPIRRTGNAGAPATLTGKYIKANRNAPKAVSKSPLDQVGDAVGGVVENIRRTVSGSSNSPIANAVRNGPNARRILNGK